MDDFLRLSGREIQSHAGSLSHEEAIEKARAEFDAYRAAHLDDVSPAERHFIEAVRESKRIEEDQQKARTANRTERQA